MFYLLHFQFHLEKTYPNSYNDKEYKMLANHCEDLSGADIQDNINLAITNQLKRDLKAKCYKAHSHQGKVTYVACARKIADFFGTPPKNSLRGQKIPTKTLMTFLEHKIHVALHKMSALQTFTEDFERF